MTAKKTTTAKSTPAKKAPAKKAAASSSSTSSTKPGAGDLVTYDVADGDVTTTYVGLLVDHQVELGADAEGKDQGHATRVAVLGDLRVVDPELLKKL